jgi:hypothetical protein
MMKPTSLLICLPLCLAALIAHGQTRPTSEFTLGGIHCSAPGYHINLGTANPGAQLFGGVTVKAPTYDLAAQTVTIYGVPGTQTTVSKVVALGDPAHDRRVIGHFHQNGTDRIYDMVADQAVYVPDNSRPGGGSIDLTGHPVLTVHMPDSLAVPAPIVADHIVVLLGDGPDYPQIDGTNGQATFVPLHQ